MKIFSLCLPATYVPTLVLNGGEDHVCLPGYSRQFSDSPIDAGACAIRMMIQFLKDPSRDPDAPVWKHRGKSRHILFPDRK